MPKLETACRVLIGGAGAPNYGDELIVRGWIDYLSKPSFLESNFTFQENNEKSSREFHLKKNDNLASEVQFSNRFALLAKEIQDLTFWQQVERGYNYISKHGISELGLQQSSDISNIASFHLHGGGYFNDIRGDKGFYLGLVASFNKLYQIPVYSTGIGFGPYRTQCHNPSMFDEIMSHFEFFESRDVDSFALLKSLAPSAKIIDGLDDCFVLPAASIFRDDSKKIRLHLSFNSSHIQNYSDAFWAWLKNEASLFDEIVFWESFPWKDKEVIKKISSVIPSCKVLSTRNLVYEIPTIALHDVFVTHRFHVHFAAARAGARGFYIAPCRYYKQKHESILKLGSGLVELNFNLLPKLEEATMSVPLDEINLRNKKLELISKCYIES